MSGESRGPKSLTVQLMISAHISCFTPWIIGLSDLYLISSFHDSGAVRFADFVAIGRSS